MSRVTRTLLVAALLGAVTAGSADAQRDGERSARAEARRGWLGLIYTPVEGRGWMAIDQVVPGSPAAKAGLTSGDTIVGWNGRTDLTGRETRLTVRPGEDVRLRVRRGGQNRDITVTAGERGPLAFRLGRDGDGPIVIRHPGVFLRGDGDVIRLDLDSLAVHADSLHKRLRVILGDSLGPALRRLEETEMPRIRAEAERARRELEREMPRIREELRRAEREVWAPVAGGIAVGARSVAGAELTEVNEGLADYFETDRGVLVLRVAPDTPAARAGLRAGDVIVSAAGKAVGNVSEVRRAVLDARDRDVELVVVRRGARQGLRLRWE